MFHVDSYLLAGLYPLGEHSQHLHVSARAIIVPTSCHAVILIVLLTVSCLTRNGRTIKASTDVNALCNNNRVYSAWCKHEYNGRCCSSGSEED